MGNDNKDRVSIDTDRIHKAREIQAQNRSNNGCTAQRLNVQQAPISRYGHNGNGLSVQPGTFLQEGCEGGEAL